MSDPGSVTGSSTSTATLLQTGLLSIPKSTSLGHLRAFISCLVWPTLSISINTSTSSQASCSVTGLHPTSLITASHSQWLTPAVSCHVHSCEAGCSCCCCTPNAWQHWQQQELRAHFPSEATLPTGVSESLSLLTTVLVFTELQPPLPRSEEEPIALGPGREV